MIKGQNNTTAIIEQMSRWKIYEYFHTLCCCVAVVKDVIEVTQELTTNMLQQLPVT
ncbi:hypothetical protein NFD58_12600 [Staphylococcus epidermidis]|nr:hypothetical protein [Staphylococcus epidermidis]